MIDVISLLNTILIVNIVLVIVMWQIYGHRIQMLIAKKGEKDLILGEFSVVFVVVVVMC